MLARILRFAGLAAALVCAENTVAQPPRRDRPIPAPVVDVTPASAAKTPLTQVVYSVADLVIPLPTRPNLEVDSLPSREANFTRFGYKSQFVDSSFFTEHARRTTEASLIGLVTGTIAPKSWSDQGGPGTIQYFPLGHALIVSHTKAVQEEVRDLLQALRRLQAVEVVLEVNVLQMAPEAAERACQELKLVCKEAKRPLIELQKDWVVEAKGKTWSAQLNKKQASSLLKTVDRDRNASVLQAPKITLGNSQIAVLETTDQQWHQSRAVVSHEGGVLKVRSEDERFTSGLRLALKPVASADHKSVHLEMNGFWSNLAGPVEQVAIETKYTGKKLENASAETTLESPCYSQVRVSHKASIPDGAAFLINAGIVPVAVPKDNFGSWLYEMILGERPTVSADRNILFLVTPRIIVLEEEESPMNPRPVPRP